MYHILSQEMIAKQWRISDLNNKKMKKHHPIRQSRAWSEDKIEPHTEISETFAQNWELNSCISFHDKLIKYWFRTGRLGINDGLNWSFSWYEAEIDWWLFSNGNSQVGCTLFVVIVYTFHILLLNVGNASHSGDQLDGDSVPFYKRHFLLSKTLSSPLPFLPPSNHLLLPPSLLSFILPLSFFSVLSIAQARRH